MADLETKRTPTVWMRNLLLGSAALNVFMAGFLFADLLKPDSNELHKEVPRVTLGGFPPDLPPELVEKFEDNFQTRRPIIEKKYEDLVQARIKIGDLLENTDIDREELDKALEQIRGLQLEIQGSIHESMVDTVLKLDPEKRKFFFIGGNPSTERGIWTQRQFDGSRWKVVYGDGEITIDLKGLGDMRTQKIMELNELPEEKKETEDEDPEG